MRSVGLENKQTAAHKQSKSLCHSIQTTLFSEQILEAGILPSSQAVVCLYWCHVPAHKGYAHSILQWVSSRELWQWLYRRHNVLRQKCPQKVVFKKSRWQPQLWRSWLHSFWHVMPIRNGQNCDYIIGPATLTFLTTSCGLSCAQASPHNKELGMQQCLFYLSSRHPGSQYFVQSKLNHSLFMRLK